MRILLNTKIIEKNNLPFNFPNELLDEKWALNIHSQTLDRLNQRGGMAPNELIGNIKKLSGKEISKYPTNLAISELKKILS